MWGDGSGVQSTSHISNWRGFSPQNPSKGQMNMGACLKFLPWKAQTENPQSKLTIKRSHNIVSSSFRFDWETQRIKQTNERWTDMKSQPLNLYTCANTHTHAHHTCVCMKIKKNLWLLNYIISSKILMIQKKIFIHYQTYLAAYRRKGWGQSLQDSLIFSPRI